MSGGNRTYGYNHAGDGLTPDGGRVSPIRSIENNHGQPDHYSQQQRYGDVSPVSQTSPHHHGDRGMATTTPGMDDLGPASVGGGIGGIALGIANNHGRDSGIEALHGTGGVAGNYHNDGYTGPAERGFNTTGSDNPYIPVPPPGVGYGASADSLRESYGSNIALGGAAAPTGQGTPRLGVSQNDLLDQPHANSYRGGSMPMNDGPYHRQSAYGSGELNINPDDIADDGDDGFHPVSSNNRRSQAGVPAAAAGAAGGAAAAGGILGGLFGGGKKNSAAENTAYDPVPGAGLEGAEKGGGSWAKPKASGGNKKRGWIVGLVLGFLIVGAIVGGAVGGIVGNRNNRDNETPDNTASGDAKKNGDLDKDSSEIQALMNNKNLHKVFPGMDYTPWGVQYPLCLEYPPSQNNVTRDMAVLSQLTNTVRLYGTDCNQTEMVLHAIDKLQLTEMKVWLGVWIDSNQTTTDRQIQQLYKVLDDTKDPSIFKGAIVGNEALYRAGPDITTAKKNLIGYMTDVRNNITHRNMDMPVATSDLGDNWDTELAKAADVVMSNVHPFFAGVTVDVAASWTWTFWQGHDASLTKGTNKKQVISEVGWPSGGGNDCGTGAKCATPTAGSVASVDNLNTFMSDWVCQALSNGTDYFWFEAFDEPWKVQFNTADENWEDKWGLMDAGRNLKPGLKIPDCGGKTAS